MAELNLKPLADRVIVEPIEEQDVTAGGIVLPETAKEKPQRAPWWPWALARRTSRAT